MIPQSADPNSGSSAVPLPLRSILAIALAALATTACNHANAPVHPPETLSTVVYEGWWANTLAEGAAIKACPPETQARCKQEAAAQVAEYGRNFSAAFHSDPLCNGLKLLPFEGSGRSSPEALQTYDALFGKPHWELQIDFVPGLQTLPWILHLDSVPAGRSAAGEGNAQSIAHATCSAMKQPESPATAY